MVREGAEDSVRKKRLRYRKELRQFCWGMKADQGPPREPQSCGVGQLIKNEENRARRRLKEKCQKMGGVVS